MGPDKYNFTSPQPPSMRLVRVKTKFADLDVRTAKFYENLPKSDI